MGNTSVILDDIASNITNVYSGPSARTAFFVAANGIVYGIGLNDIGQLGVGNTESSDLPVEVKHQSDQMGGNISASSTHTLSATTGVARPVPSPSPIPDSSELLFWGFLQSIGEEIPDTINKVVPTILDEIFVSDTSAGSEYTLVVLGNGSAMVAGYIESLSDYVGHFGVVAESGLTEGLNGLQLIDKVRNRAGLTVAAPEFKAVVAGVESMDDASAGTGMMHSLFIDIEGNIYAAGDNSKGQLCLGDDEKAKEIPTQIDLPDDETAVSAAAGVEFTLIVTSSGKVYGCGSNEVGQLGLGDDEGNQDSPVEVTGLSDATSVFAGMDFSLIRTSKGLFTMGGNEFGQLCLDPENSQQTTPKNIYDDSVLSFAAGWQSSYVLLEDGSIKSCGLNNDGQLGDGTYESSFDASVNLDKNITDLYAGPAALTAFFAAADGLVYGTGLNNFGQLGVGLRDSYSEPVEVRFNHDESGIGLSVSDTHTVAQMSTAE